MASSLSGRKKLEKRHKAMTDALTEVIDAIDSRFGVRETSAQLRLTPGHETRSYIEATLQELRILAGVNPDLVREALGFTDASSRYHECSRERSGATSKRGTRP